MIQKVDKYVLEGELGRGAMGSVWLSRHPGLNIPVAVKILDPTLAAEDPDYQDRFIKEGRLAASINHQHVVRIIDAGKDGEIYFLVMELVDGADAKQLLEKRGALPVEEVLELAICISEALATAHSAGIVHRDIKPDNILVTSQGQVKLADLGIAKQMNEDYGTTLVGTTMGTPYYIAPEQAVDSSSVDCRCDIYALGGTLYHLLTGTLPFTGPSSMAILMSHTKDPLPHPKERKADLPDNICSVVCKMMEKDPDDRYQDCYELIADLKAVRNNKNPVASAKKKKIKAPVKQRSSKPAANKELGGVPKKSRPRKPATKKKKSPVLPIVISIIAVLLVIVGIVSFQGNGQEAARNADVEIEDDSSSTAKVETPAEEGTETATKDRQKGTKGIRKAIKKEFKREAKEGNIRERIKAGIERDNPGVTLNIDRIKVSKGSLSVDLNKLEIKNINSLKDFPITHLLISENRISDYSPLKYVKLEHLEAFRSKTKIPLRFINMTSMKHLRMTLSDLDDVKELNKFQGPYLAVKQHPSMLSYLKNSNLYRIDIDTVNKPLDFKHLPSTVSSIRLYGAKGVSSIKDLSHLKLREFQLTGSPCRDISVLKGMSLENVSLVGTMAEDLSALANAPIKELALPYHCKDLSFLSTLKSLKKLAVPRPLWRRELEQFRGSDVVIEGFDRKGGSWWLDWGHFRATSSAKFWKMFDDNRRRRKSRD